jgi:hypothetical protein
LFLAGFTAVFSSFFLHQEEKTSQKKLRSKHIRLFSAFAVSDAGAYASSRLQSFFNLFPITLQAQKVRNQICYLRSPSGSSFIIYVNFFTWEVYILKEVIFILISFNNFSHPVVITSAITQRLPTQRFGIFQAPPLLQNVERGNSADKLQSRNISIQNNSNVAMELMVFFCPDEPLHSSGYASLRRVMHV